MKKETIKITGQEISKGISKPYQTPCATGPHRSAKDRHRPTEKQRTHEEIKKYKG